MRVLNLICRLPTKIIKSVVPFYNVESMGKMPRRRPLHTCGSSFLAIAHNLCLKFQEFDGPLGSMTKRANKISKLFLPFVCSWLYQWLTVLCFIDDQILAVERVMEFIFPPSKRLFDKIDRLVCIAEALPENLDDVWRKIPIFIHQNFPFLDWFVCHLISWLSFALSYLCHWGTKATKEKDISVDENSKNSEFNEESASFPVESLSDFSKGRQKEERTHFEPSNDEKAENVLEKSVDCEVIHKAMKKLHMLENQKGKVVDKTTNCAFESPMSAAYKSAVSSPSSYFSQDEMSPFGLTGKPETMKCSYKEVLEIGTKEDGKTRDKENGKVDGEDGEKGNMAKDQILELFEESWHSK